MSSEGKLDVNKSHATTKELLPVIVLFEIFTVELDPSKLKLLLSLAIVPLPTVTL